MKGFENIGLYVLLGNWDCGLWSLLLDNLRVLEFLKEEWVLEDLEFRIGVFEMVAKTTRAIMEILDV